MLIAALLISAMDMAGADRSPAAGVLREDAEKHFREGVRARDHPDQAHHHFAAALAIYETLRGQGANNTALYRNQGNAALLAGDLPAAILAYRRGLRLDPANAFVQGGLESARDQVEYPRSDLRPAGDNWPAWLPRPSENLLLGLSVGLYTLGCITFTRWLMIRRLAFLCLSGFVIFLACGLCLAWGTKQQQMEQTRTHPLIVVRETTPLRTGNGMSYPSHRGLSSARRGMEGRLQFTRGDWLQVEFPGGALGWLPRERVLLDTP